MSFKWFLANPAAHQESHQGGVGILGVGLWDACPCPSPQTGRPALQRVNGLCLCGKCQRRGADSFAWRPLMRLRQLCRGAGQLGRSLWPLGSALNPARKVLWGFLHALAFVLSEYIRLPSLSQEAGFAPLWEAGEGAENMAGFWLFPLAPHSCRPCPQRGCPANR